MPLVTGLELVHHLRKNNFEGKIMVISGFLTDQLLMAYRDKKVDKIIQKNILCRRTLIHPRRHIGSMELKLLPWRSSSEAGFCNQHPNFL